MNKRTVAPAATRSPAPSRRKSMPALGVLDPIPTGVRGPPHATQNWAWSLLSTPHWRHLMSSGLLGVPLG